MSEGPFAGYEQQEDDDSDHRPPGTPPLVATAVDYTEPDPADSAPSPSAIQPDIDLGSAHLLSNFAPNHPELVTTFEYPLASSPDPESRRDLEMTDPALAERHANGPRLPPIEPPTVTDGNGPISIPHRQGSDLSADTYDAQILGAKAAAAVRESEANGSAGPDPSNQAPSPQARVDSAQDDSEEAQLRKPPSPTATGRSSPLRVRTAVLSLPSQPRYSSTAASLARRAPPPDADSAPLPALHAGSSSSRLMDPPSPTANRLPSLRQLEATGQLDKLAEVATQQEPVAPYARHHSRSLGSATSPSPLSPFYSHAISAHASPATASHYAFTARSPTSTISEPQYGSPPFPTQPAYYPHRRTSSLLDHVPSGPPSLPSASSSGSSNTPGSSSTGSSGTNHTTPIEPTPLEPALRATLPPPPSMILAGYRCDEPGCNAHPFTTQYLLSSHKNVHSSNRPFYCSVKECTRSEGGRGFKRKNEMIRHGLVHSSPGYVCPFCSEKEHKYPRPDNLLRHVHVHHSDIERDDPRLAEVLSRRAEGTGKARRRRTTIGSIGGGSSSGSGSALAASISSLISGDVPLTGGVVADSGGAMDRPDDRSTAIFPPAPAAG